MTTRGLRNKNPGNIRRGQQWQGLAVEQLDNDFCTFTDEVWGIRALVKILLAYQDRYDCRNILQIVSRYAPSNENNTEAYIKAVCSGTAIDRGQPLDVRDYRTCRKLVMAIIRHENGQQPYSDEIIDKGLEKAGVVKA